MAGVERGDIGLGQLGRLGELGLEPIDDRLAVAVEHPQRQAERPHVLAAQASLLPRPNGFTASRVSCEMLKWTSCHLARLPSSSGLVVAGLGEVAA